MPGSVNPWRGDLRSYSIGSRGARSLSRLAEQEKPMRPIAVALLITTLMTGALVLSGRASAGADIGDDPTGKSGFPRDAASLRQLDAEQLRIVRRASAQCWHAGQGGFGGRGPVARACVMSATEGALAARKDEILKAYSDALPMNVRYDRNRPSLYWQRLVIYPPRRELR
jgi:hypothetical protein